MMIFLDQEINDSDEIFSLGIYYPWKDPRSKTDRHSNDILDLKYREEEEADTKRLEWKGPKKQRAIDNFRRRLDAMLSLDIAITVVPPHQVYSRPSGIQELARLLASNDRIDATRCLVRHTAIDKQSLGGARSLEQHMETI